MRLDFSDKIIIMREKIITELDKKALNFIQYINFEYVIVGGYISILFGRSRGTEDIDIIIKELSLENFTKFVEKLRQKYYALNADDVNELYSMLKDGLSIRFAEIGEIIPNFELRFPLSKYSSIALNNRIKLQINTCFEFMISPIELQIAYKLYLGSEKDVEDAIYLWEIFKEFINRDKLMEYIKELEVKKTYGIEF